ncbi:hypothetical protein PoB_005452700, partial [Plakobranchus ocellatus]
MTSVDGCVSRRHEVTVTCVTFCCSVAFCECHRTLMDELVGSFGADLRFTAN